jgi:hypothetical protein
MNLKKFGGYLFLISLVLNSCSERIHEDTEVGSSETGTTLDQARLIVNKSIDAHGGWERWEYLQGISYKKTTILYDSSGNEESKIAQVHSYTLKPSLEGNIEWNDGADLIKIIYSDGQGTRYVNEIAELDYESMESATGSFLSAYYVLFQPWKLLDPGTSLEFIGEEKLSDGREIIVVSPVYGERKEGDDQWWYYIDKETNLLAANMVDHSGRFSLISNLDYDNSTDLIFNYHRKSHFVDSARNIKYLRAEYFYEDFQLIFE